MARFRRGRVSAKVSRHIVDKASQKTKVRILASLLGFSGGSNQTLVISNAVDSARTTYGDASVKPFSRIQILHFDIAIYQSGASVLADGFVDWFLYKQPAANAVTGISADPALSAIPFIFKTGRAAVPMLSSTGLPTIYHLSGDIKIPPRFQIQAPNDQIFMAFRGLSGTGVTYSVNGTITYMFKI